VAAFFLVFYFKETYNRWQQMKAQMLTSEGCCLTQLMLVRAKVRIRDVLFPKAAVFFAADASHLLRAKVRVQ
jgi:hypothetical protein